LESKINSKDFFIYIQKKLEVNLKQFSFKSFYTSKFFERKYFTIFKSISEKKISQCSLIVILKYLTIRVFLELYRIIFLRNKVEVLFEYSQGSSGYKRPIHIDSSSRLFVFLIYLNDLDVNCGGGLTLYNKDSNGFSPVKTIQAKQGRLVFFLNDNYSFHSADNFTANDKCKHRYFIYGTVTILSGKNPFNSSQNINYANYY